MPNRCVVSLVLCFMVFGQLAAQEQLALTTNKQIASYAIGTQLGAQLLRALQSQPVEIDQDAVLLAIGDIVRGEGPRIDDDTLNQAMLAFQQEAAEQQAGAAEANLEQAMAFLAENKEKEGVVETDSGLQYKIVESGQGSSPAPDDMVVVHYSGRLLDDTEFDSSYKRGQPAEFQVNQVIRGWQEALVLMKPGDRWEVCVPPALGYGPTGAGSMIGPNHALIFEISLIEIKPAQASTQ